MVKYARAVYLTEDAAKRKREEDQEQQQKLDEGISKYFNANTKTAPQKAKVQ